MRSVIRDSRWRWAFWPVPLIFLAVGLALPGFTHGIDESLDIAVRGADPSWEFLPGSVEASRAVASTVAAAMLSFIGVVFSISVIALQMAASQLSPRILRIFILQRLTKWTLGVFVGTFAFSLSVLGFLDDGDSSDRHEFLPVLSVLTIWFWVSTSLVLFIAYVSRLIKLMQPVALIDLTALEAWYAFRHLRYEDSPIRPEQVDWGEQRFVVRSRRTGVVTNVDVSRLIRMARSGDWVLRVRPRIGDFLTRDSPLVEGYARRTDGRGPSGRDRFAEFLIRRSFRFGSQRVVTADPAYGLRLLVDIAVRALSAAINDPTTAVQALDRIVELLRVAGNVPDPTGVHTDRLGVPRVVRELPCWDRLVRLGCTEIRRCGADSPQVTRRLLAGLDDLAGTLPEDRRPVLSEQRILLVEAVQAAVPNLDEREVSLRPDREGLG